MQGAGTQVSRELETQVMITALALPYGGKILFAATETGVVRCYKYPLTGKLEPPPCKALSHLALCLAICLPPHHAPRQSQDVLSPCRGVL